MGSSFFRGHATPAQRAEVLRLRAEGVPVRETAARVFGSQRFRGRVERIVAAAGSRVVPLAPLRGVTAAEAEGLSSVELIGLFVDRRLAFLVESGTPPSTSELRQLLDLQRQLAGWQFLERAKERRRPPDG
jgi:hypothetical protein